MFSTIPKQIYDRLFAILSTAPTLNYFKTKQRAYAEVSADLLAPTLYPWFFIDEGSISNLEVHRFPKNWVYQFIVPIVYMSFADKGKTTDLVFSQNLNANKGTGDMTADIGNVLWAHKNDFGVQGVIDWTIGRVGTPDVLTVQRILVNPLVRGRQMDLVFQISEVFPI